MITLQEISDELEACEHASKGPAVWASDAGDTPKSALKRLTAHYNKALEVSGSAVLHQVDLPDERTEIDGTALCFAVTGNGPKGGANARFIAGALDPRLGWEAMMREVVRERAISMKLDSVILEAISVVAQFLGKNDPTDAYLAVQQIDRVLMQRETSKPSSVEESAPTQLAQLDAIKEARNKACEIAIVLQRRLALLEREHPELVKAQPDMEPALWQLKRVGFVPLRGDVHASNCQCAQCRGGGTPREQMRDREFNS